MSATSLDFGDALPADERQKLRPGACDGTHPEYTEAWDIAGIVAARALAKAVNGDTDSWGALLEGIATTYDEKFGRNLPKGYGSYCVLWPCRTFPPERGPGRDAFHEVGAQHPEDWRYFPLAKAHQGLLAGNRDAGHGTLDAHFEIESMRGWYALDEGGPSAPGNWGKVVSNWKVSRQGPGGVESAAAMPHGWAIAEFELLLRDSLAFEHDDKLVLFAGVSEEWFKQPMSIKNLPTHFGTMSVEWDPAGEKVKLALPAATYPSGGVFVRTPNGDVKVPGEPAK